MGRLCMAIAACCLLLALSRPAYALEISKKGEQVKREWTGEELAGHAAFIPQELLPRYINASAQVDTYTIVNYDFEAMDWQGWTKVDNTRKAQGCFFHVDDFAGLPGWSPLEGAKSMWCGARPDEGDGYMCSWASAPGYGNMWSQAIVSDPFDTEYGHFTLSFRGLLDIEPDYDYISIDYDEGSSI